jgi:hypothetical protein
MEVSGQLHAPACLRPGKSPLYPFDRSPGGPQSRFWHCGVQKRFLPLPGIEPRLSNPSLYRLNHPGFIIVCCHVYTVDQWHIEFLVSFMVLILLNYYRYLRCPFYCAVICPWCVLSSKTPSPLLFLTLHALPRYLIVLTCLLMPVLLSGLPTRSTVVSRDWSTTTQCSHGVFPKHEASKRKKYGSLSSLKCYIRSGYYSESGKSALN